jgi:glycosyltransferase involved in cell wall biosynthesis
MRIALYCGHNFMPWGPRSLWSGIGGSEEAAILVTRELARLGCDVTVYTNLEPGARGVHDGVRWLPCASFDDEPPGDVFIAWRTAAYVELAKGWGQAHHWLHNRQDDPYPEHITPRLDRLFVVSRSHANDAGFSARERAKVYVTSNGLDPRFFRDAGYNEPDRAIYASCPARGLLEVLDMWPRIRRAVPAAKLDVYNGFTPVYEAMAALYPGLQLVKTRILPKLEQPGVTFHGMVGQDKLAEGFARAGVWVYPTTTRETSCITAMKALAMGCIPITSGIAGVGETLDGRDFGPTHPTRSIADSRWRLWLFRRRVIRAMKEGASDTWRAKRKAWSEWARERYSWHNVAADWLALFRDIEASKHPHERVA